MNLTISDLGYPEPHVSATLSAELVNRLAATLDMPPISPGDALPILWHWSCFTPNSPTDSLGIDGHPAPSESLRSYPRRMWGAGRVELVRPLLADGVAARNTRLATTRLIEGRSGALLIATVEHTYVQQGQECLREEQTIVYRPAGPPVPLPGGSVTPEVGGHWHQRVRPDSRLLFRYSAATFNTHRIHYDLQYAREVEGYPTLVVQAPLSAQLIAGGASRNADAPLSKFSFRALSPLFADLEFTILGETHGRLGDASITRNDGETAMQATYELAK